jgi:hypothetical protein
MKICSRNFSIAFIAQKQKNKKQKIKEIINQINSPELVWNGFSEARDSLRTKYGN